MTRIFTCILAPHLYFYALRRAHCPLLQLSCENKEHCFSNFNNDNYAVAPRMVVLLRQRLVSSSEIQSQRAVYFRELVQWKTLSLPNTDSVDLLQPKKFIAALQRISDQTYNSIFTTVQMQQIARV